MADVTPINRGWPSSWKFEKANYNRDQVYGKSVDERGHSNYLRIRLQPEDYNIIVTQVLGKDSLFPHRSLHEFIRDSLIHNLVYWSQKLQTYDPELDSYVFDVEMADRVAKKRQTKDWTRQLVKDVEEIANDLVQRDQIQQAVKELVEIRDQFADSDEPHHMYITKYVDRKIADLKQRLGKKKT